MADEKPFGRPTLYKPEYCEQLIEHMSQGLSFEAFGGVLRVSKQTLYDWEKANKDFLDAKQIGLECSRFFWENLGKKHIINKSDSEFQCGSKSRSLNASVWIFNMKNRFGWRDKQPGEADVVVNNITEKSREEMEARISEYLEKKKANGND